MDNQAVIKKACRVPTSRTYVSYLRLVPTGSRWICADGGVPQPRGVLSGLRVCVFSHQSTRHGRGYDDQVRQVIRLAARTIDKHGLTLLIPELTLESWWTSTALTMYATPKVLLFEAAYFPVSEPTD